MDISKPILEVISISKSFPGVKAVDEVSLKIQYGEIHGLVGANGAGKSTLIKILAGYLSPDEGQIKIEDCLTSLNSPQDSHHKGIVTVHQEIDVPNDLTISQCIFLGDEKRFVSYGLINAKKMNEEARKILDSIDFNISEKTPMSRLSVGNKQMVMIAQALSKNAKIMIFDEPTSALSEKEAYALFEQIKKLKLSGVSVIYISHHMEEIFELCDRATVLRDGQNVCTFVIDNIQKDELVKAMIGREINNCQKSLSTANHESVFRVNNLVTNDHKVNGFSFELKKGEVLGFYGITGAGRTEMAKAIFTGEGIESGEVYIGENKFNPLDTAHAIKNGIVYASENRKEEGLLLGLSIKKNISIAIMKKISRFGLISDMKEKTNACKYVNELSIKTTSIEKEVKNLSGGNQQKVVLSKWLACDSSIIILDEPTVGIDVGAKDEILKLITDLTHKGKSIIIISSELDELMKSCDRIAVVRQGTIKKIFSCELYDKHNIMMAATGGN